MYEKDNISLPTWVFPEIQVLEKYTRLITQFKILKEKKMIRSFQEMWKNKFSMNIFHDKNLANYIYKRFILA